MKCESILGRLWQGDGGQDLLEYALLLVLIVLIAASAIAPLGNTIAKVFVNANACLSTPSNCGT